MRTNATSVKLITREAARERLVAEARRLAHRDDDAEMLGGHIASELEARRVMRLFGLAAIAALLGAAVVVLGGLG